MKLQEFMDNLKALIQDNPDALNYEVVTSKDAAGNGYDVVTFNPSIGVYDIEDKDFNPIDLDSINAICIN